MRLAVPLVLVPCLVATAMLLPACSKKDKGTNPVVQEPFESNDLGTSGPTSIFVHTFMTNGSFGFRCRHHPIMTGTVTVAPGGADSVTWPLGNTAFGTPTPGSTVRVGGYVKWVNSSGTHTVTRP